jgi:outer membrane protein
MISTDFFYKKLKLCASVAMISATTLAGNAQAITLNDALVQAYSYNPALKAQRSALEAVQEQLPTAYSGFLPSVAASYQKSKETQDLSGRASETSHPDTRSLTLSQPVFDGLDSWYQIKQSKNEIARAQAQLRSTEQQILTDAVIAYIDVVRTTKIVELSINNEKVLAEQLQATSDRFDLGETTRTDVSQAKSRLARAESDRIQAEGDYIQARAEYKNVLGEDASNDMTMPSTLPNIPDSFESMLNTALVNNPQIIAASEFTESRHNSVRRSKSTLLPSVSINGSLTRQSGLSSTRLSSDVDTDSISLDVRVPLYQSGAEYSAIRLAKRNEESARYTLEDTRNQVVSTVTNSWQQVITTRANTKATQASVDSAQLALEGVKQEQEVGSRTTLDVLDAEQELFIARVNLVTAVRNSVLAVYNVKSATGNLTIKNLNLDATIYDDEEYLNDVKYKFIGF